MAYQKITNSLRAQAKKALEESAAKIENMLISNGLIEKGQKTVNSEKLIAASRLYLREVLSLQAEKESTGTAGKFLDLLERALMWEARGRHMNVADIRCRPAGKADIIIQCAEQGRQVSGLSRIAVEIKTGGGALGAGATLGEAWEAIAQAVETGKWVAWAFDTAAIDFTADDLRKAEGRIAWVFLPLGELLEKLSEYNGGIGTWLKENRSRGTVNWQTVNSSKKVDFLWEVYENSSYDFQHFRDTGELRKVSER